MRGLLGYFDRQNTVFKTGLAVFLVNILADVEGTAATAAVAFLTDQRALLVLFFVLMVLL